MICIANTTAIFKRIYANQIGAKLTGLLKNCMYDFFSSLYLKFYDLIFRLAILDKNRDITHFVALTLIK